MPPRSAMKKRVPCQISLRRPQVATLLPSRHVTPSSLSPPAAKPPSPPSPLLHSPLRRHLQNLFRPPPFLAHHWHRPLHHLIKDSAWSSHHIRRPPGPIASNHLISVYSKYGLMDHTHHVFDQIPQRNTVSWITLISSYSKIGPTKAAIGCFQLILTANTGKEIYCRIYRAEKNVSNIFVSNSLINLYTKCGMMVAAERVFGGMMHPNTVLWSSLLAGYCQHRESREALRVFSQAQKVGVEINEFLLAGMVKACAGIENWLLGKYFIAMS